MLDKPGFLLHAEGFAVLTVSFAAYHQLNGSWLLFFLLFLWPDLLILGYLANVRLGAALYNLAHTEVGPLLLGYGLKCPTFFKDTHNTSLRKQCNEWRVAEKSRRVSPP